MSTISGILDLSEIPDDLYDPSVPLRAVVAFDGEVLGSTLIKQGSRDQKLPFDVEFRAPFAGAADLPCNVILLVGPDVRDLDLLSLDTLKVDIDLTRGKDNPRLTDAASTPENGGAKPTEPKQQRDGFRVSVGILRVPPTIYHCWIFCCRTYTIRGRVVCRHWRYDPQTKRYTFCDEPVPGATVEAYDIDRWLFWFRRDLIASAVTDINGNFTITFRWCCLNWRPWLVRNWQLDPEILGRVRDLLAGQGIVLPPPPPDPDPFYLQDVLARASFAAKRPLLPAGVVDGAVSAEDLLAVLPAAPDLAALRIWPWWDWNDCAPDVNFRVTQQCDGQAKVIRNESIAQTRWDIPTTLNVTLLANDNACCIPSCRDPECPGCLKLTWVGCTPTDQISTSAAPVDLRGYALTSAMEDRPFYGNLRIRGAIGSDIDYFKVQVSRNGGPWTDLAQPAFAGFSRSYWGPGAIAVTFAPVVKNGQTVMITRRHYEVLNALPTFDGAVVWFDFDTLFYFDTQAGLTPDGLYQLRLIGYDADAADNLILSSARVLPTCGVTGEESVYIRVDNQAMVHPAPTALHPCGPGTVHTCTNEPDCHIRRICINEGTPDEHCIAACDIVRLAASDTVTIHFSVTVPPTMEDGHLGGYELQAEYGVSSVFAIGTGTAGTFEPDPTFVVGPDYAAALSQGAPRPHWYGGDYKVRLRGSDFPACCAYLLRLRAWKRTTDGCTSPRWVHHNEFEVTFTVLRRELCPDICN